MRAVYEHERMRRIAAQQATQRGHVIAVECPNCERDVAVPYALGIETVGFRLVAAQLHALPFEHVCPGFEPDDG